MQIRALAAAAAPAAGEVLAVSHAEYPPFRHLLADPRRRLRVLRPFMVAAARDAAEHGHVLVAEDGEGIAGVAVWMPPGAFPLSARRKAAMTPRLLRTALAAGAASPAFVRIGVRLEGSGLAEGSWYLQAMGVHPRAQRRGVGTRLIDPVLALADDDGVPCTVHSGDPANIAYYARFGFEVSQPAIHVFADGPAYVGMTRPPRDAGG